MHIRSQDQQPHKGQVVLMMKYKGQEPEFCLIYSQFFWLLIILKIILNSFGYLLFLKLFQNNISRRPNEEQLNDKLHLLLCS